MRVFTCFFLAILLALPPATVFARNIVLTNDDGLTSNVVALYRALKEQGHDVIVSVPCDNQSGMGAALKIAKPLGPLDAACLNGAAKAGEPGAGPMSRSDLASADFYYVDGTPVMALLYGLDILSQQRWDKAPDLVLSGPNEGQNVGAVIISSGTVSNAQYAAIRGIPAIALSAGMNTAANDTLDNPRSVEVARRSAELVAALDHRAKAEALLPPGIALNVNFPDHLEGAQWQLSRVGTYNAYNVRFAEDLAKSASPLLNAMAREQGVTLPHLPGIDFGHNDAISQADQQDDEAVVYKTNIAISPMQAGYEYSRKKHDWLGWYLRDIFLEKK